MSAQSLEDDDFETIKESVVAICGEFARSGSSSEVDASGAINVDLLNLSRLFADFSSEGEGEFSADEYIGVLREELGDEIKDNRACRMKIWNDFVSKVLLKSGDEATDLSNRAAQYVGQSSIFDCKTTQYFEVCVDSSRIRGNFADLSLTLQNRTEEKIRLCQSTPHAYAISEDGKKSEVGRRYDCRDIMGGGAERFGFLFEFDGSAGQSFDATVIFTEPSTQFTFRNLR
ncbi:hypothetical protein [Ruegeria marisrubri]|uniref:hypothetical protein n=1 Tax=Ruegeria marisrubri TaxID=1685379 RepID=UPI001969ABE1|nr:hypothetical protein [Ruegeria marisrubri]